MRTLAMLPVVVVAGAVAGGALAAENLPPPLDAVVAAERAFAKRCGEVGIRASFLEFFASDAVSFLPDPGNARERLEKRPKEPPPILLAWAPEQAEIASSGELGWTTGPFELTDKSPSPRPPAHGYYFSLWKKQPDGTWKVVLDQGVATPAAPMPAVAQAVGPTGKAGAGAGAGDAAAVRRRDEEFCKSAEAGAGKAYTASLAAEARVHRDGAAPVVGDKAVRAWAKSLAGVMACKPAAAFASGGLGYTYGSWEARATPGGPVAEKGFYTRVWRLDGGWRIAADVASSVK